MSDALRDAARLALQFAQGRTLPRQQVIDTLQAALDAPTLNASAMTVGPLNAAALTVDAAPTDPVDLTDDACDRLTARVIEKLAEKNGHAPEAVADAVAAENAIVRRSLMRTAYMLGHTVGADEIDRLRAQVGGLQADRYYLQGVVADMTAQVAAPQARDVTRILLAVVPGDGDGEEVYARSLSDVEDALQKLAERAEDAELERDRARAQVAALQARAEKAERTLLAMGCTYEGGELWRPPAQPARVPLTDGQIDDAMQQAPGAVFGLMHGDACTAGEFKAALRRIARAVERECARRWGVTLADDGGANA